MHVIPLYQLEASRCCPLQVNKSDWSVYIEQTWQTPLELIRNRDTDWFKDVWLTSLKLNPLKPSCWFPSREFYTLSQRWEMIENRPSVSDVFCCRQVSLTQRAPDTCCFSLFQSLPSKTPLPRTEKPKEGVCFRSPWGHLAISGQLTPTLLWGEQWSVSAAAPAYWLARPIWRCTPPLSPPGE